MVPRVATVINYCSNEYRFVRACVEAVASVSAQVLIPVADHFFDGTPENATLVEWTRVENPESTLIPYAWTPGQEPRYWHNYSRLVGARHVSADVDWVFFLDADEIVDTALFAQFIATLPAADFRSCRLANYWYFREPIYRATTLEESGLLVRRRLSERVDLHHRKERAQFLAKSSPRFVTMNGEPMIHHYSWVRTKDEMLRKVRTWGHRSDKNWVARVEQEFSRPFNGTCFVHDYRFVEVEDRFGLASPAAGGATAAGGVDLRLTT